MQGFYPIRATLRILRVEGIRRPTMACYSGGSGHVARWVSSALERTSTEFLAHIPELFKATGNKRNRLPGVELASNKVAGSRGSPQLLLHGQPGIEVPVQGPYPQNRMDFDKPIVSFPRP